MSGAGNARVKSPNHPPHRFFQFHGHSICSDIVPGSHHQAWLMARMLCMVWMMNSASWINPFLIV